MLIKIKEMISILKYFSSIFVISSENIEISTFKINEIRL